MRNAKSWICAAPILALSILALSILAAACSVEVGATTTTPASDLTEPAELPSEAGDVVEIVRVIDGDSVELNIDGKVVDGRLEGVNAPELFDSDNKRTCNGANALEALVALVADQDVQVSGSEFDRFGRLLVELSVDGVSVSDTLVDQGWLLVTADNRARREALKMAADLQQGMFGPECGSPSHNLRISSIQADPAGNDRSNLAEEWVELQNKSDQVVDLAGWTIRDETTGHRFELPKVSLPKGAKIKIRSGSGTNSNDDLYLGESFPVWSNGDETVLLIDPNGVVAEVVFLVGVGE